METAYGELWIGAEVRSGEHLGYLRQILVDSTARTVAALLVDRGPLQRDMLVPVDAVVAVRPDGIEIRTTAADAAPPRHAVHAGTIALRHDHPIVGTDEPVGWLGRLLVEPESWRITTVVVRYGRTAGRRVRVATEAVSAFTDEAIIVAFDRAVLRTLVPYRPDDTIATDLHRALWHDPVLHLDAEHMAVEVSNGVVQLRGYVADGLRRSWAAELARRVEGVWSAVGDHRFRTGLPTCCWIGTTITLWAATRCRRAAVGCMRRARPQLTRYGSRADIRQRFWTKRPPCWIMCSSTPTPASSATLSFATACICIKIR